MYKLNIFLIVIVIPLLIYSCGRKDEPVKTSTETNTAQDTSKKNQIVKDTIPVTDPKVEGKRIDEAAMKISEFLKSYTAADSKYLKDFDRNYIFDSYDLNGDGKYEYLVGFISTYYCGNAGCKIVVLNSDFGLNSEIENVYYPIFISNSEISNGWKNIYINSSDGYHVLKYNRGKYPSIAEKEPGFNIDDDTSKKQLLKDKLGRRRSF